MIYKCESKKEKTYLESLYRIENKQYKSQDYSTWYRVLDIAINKNVLVFDSWAKKNEFTARLISLMESVQEECKNKKITDLFIPRITKIEGYNRYRIAESFSKKIRIHKIRALNKDGKFIKYYLDVLKATFPKEDSNLVIGLNLYCDDVFNKRFVLIGRF